MREHEAGLIKNTQHLEALESSSVACTGIVDGVVMCCGGVSPFLNGNAEIWLIPSAYVAENPTVFARHLKKWLFAVREDLALTRMQTACLDDDLHNQWMTFLGFEKEGVLRKYHNGIDYNMWSRLWGGVSSD